MMSARRRNVYIIYYSTHGHIEKLARKVAKGVEKAGVTAKLFQVKETLSEEVLTKMHAVAKPYDVPIITAVELKDADGILFGIPARCGMLPAQMKALFDSCGQLWMNDELHHKFVGTFFSTGSIGGGQESTTLTTMPFFSHMGMIYVPFGSHRKRPLPEGEVAGGSAWGAGTYSEKGREASEYELEIVQFQGEEFASIVTRTGF